MSPGYHGNRHIILAHFDTGLYQHVVRAYQTPVFFPYENEKFLPYSAICYIYGSKQKPYNNIYTHFDSFL